MMSMVSGHCIGYYMCCQWYQGTVLGTTCDVNGIRALYRVVHLLSMVSGYCIGYYM